MTAAYFGMEDDMIEPVNDFGTGGAAIDDTAPEFMGDSPEQPSEGTFTGIKQLLGSIGANVKSATQTARDLGTAVGTVKAQLKGVPATYRKAETAAANPSAKSTISQWFAYATPTDKIMVGIGVLALAVAIYQATKVTK